MRRLSVFFMADDGCGAEVCLTPAGARAARGRLVQDKMKTIRWQLPVSYS